MHKITQVFRYKGATLSIADAMQALMALWKGDPYAQEKAAGALGGASRSGFIAQNHRGYWVRQR